MGVREIILMGFAILGGLALFIFGMNVMSDGLRQSAGSSLRHMLARATRSRLAGIGMGTLLGTLVQSSATTVMLVGFINAGLMTLQESIPPMLGANIGTSLSIQMISLRLGDYCFIAITAGFLLHMAALHPRIKHAGLALLGFGLIFLGMNIMSGAIKPHRDLFARLLVGIHGQTRWNMIGGVLLSAAVTGIIQSSGAVIVMCFALISAGVFTDLRQVFPIVLGANIGTCATALLGSIGTNIEARRSAVSHLLFNVLNVSLALVMAPLYLRLAALTSDKLIRQTANLNTGNMLVGATIFLILSAPYARLITRLVRSRKPPPQPSFLDRHLLEYPEKAIFAAIFELQRITRVCAQSLKLTFEIIFTDNRRDIQNVKLNENIINEIKKAMKEYLAALTRKYLSRRQTLLLQHINRCMADLERIGDHIDELCDITLRRHQTRGARLNREALDLLMRLYEASAKVLHLVAESLDPESTDFQSQAQAILAARDEYVEQSQQAKDVLTQRIARHELPSLVGVFFSEYVSALDRIVKHAKMIALAEKQPFFWIKREKLERRSKDAPDIVLPEKVDPHDYLDRLHQEYYL